VWTGIGVALLGALLMALPGLTGMRMMDGAYALAFIGFFLVLVALAAPRLKCPHVLRYGGDAWIGREGVYVRGQLHTWKPPPLTCGAAAPDA